MKRHRLILSLAASGIGLTGCASGPLSHLLMTGAGAGGGAVVASMASHGNPALTAAGGAGGALVAESVNYFQTKAESKAFATGYDKGRSDAAKQQYWLLQRQQGPPGESTMLYPVPVPAQEIDGINYQATTKYITLPQ